MEMGVDHNTTLPMEAAQESGCYIHPTEPDEKLKRKSPS